MALDNGKDSLDVRHLLASETEASYFSSLAHSHSLSLSLSLSLSITLYCYLPLFQCVPMVIPIFCWQWIKPLLLRKVIEEQSTIMHILPIAFGLINSWFYPPEILRCLFGKKIRTRKNNGNKNEREKTREESEANETEKGQDNITYPRVRQLVYPLAKYLQHHPTWYLSALDTRWAA